MMTELLMPFRILPSKQDDAEKGVETSILIVPIVQCWVHTIEWDDKATDLRTLRNGALDLIHQFTQKQRHITVPVYAPVPTGFWARPGIEVELTFRSYEGRVVTGRLRATWNPDD